MLPCWSAPPEKGTGGRAWEERRKERKKGRMKMMWGKERTKEGGSEGRERRVKSRERGADKKVRMEGREKSRQRGSWHACYLLGPATDSNRLLLHKSNHFGPTTHVRN